jgi:hypothetical protein
MNAVVDTVNEDDANSDGMAVATTMTTTTATAIDGYMCIASAEIHRFHGQRRATTTTPATAVAMPVYDCVCTARTARIAHRPILMYRARLLCCMQSIRTGNISIRGRLIKGK